jgi:hypothetical protein
MKVLLKTLLTFIMSSYMYSQDNKPYEQFTEEYDLMRYIEIKDSRYMDNWKIANTKVHFNKNFGGHIKIEIEDDFTLELFQKTAVEERFESRTNLKYLFSISEDEDGNEYEVLFYLHEQKDIVIYVNTGTDYTHMYQFIKRKYYEKTDTP